MFHLNDKHIYFTKDRNVGIFKNSLGESGVLKMKNCVRKKLPATIEHDCIITKSGLKYFIIIPQKIEMTNDTKSHGSCSLDPGSRAFQTLFSPNGHVSKFGVQEGKKITTYLRKIDTIKNSNLRKKLREKIKGLVYNLHNQTIGTLTKNYKNVLLPYLNVPQIVKTKRFGDLPKIVKRTLLSLSHFKFREKLKVACFRTNTTLYVVNESYTTKTCGRCGVLNNVGSSDTYVCLSCHYTLDRDIHGARNVLLKTLTLV